MVLSLEDPGEPHVEDRQVRDRPRRDPDGEPVVEARGGRDAGGRAARGQAGAVAADDAHGPRAVRASAISRGSWRDPRRRARRHGKVGAEVCRAVHADADLELVAGISRSKAGEKASDALGLEGSDVVLAENLDSFVEAGVEVAVDFTSGGFAAEHVAWAIEHGVHIVVGTTGFEIDEGWREAPVGVFVAPNFAIGAVLMQRFARGGGASTCRRSRSSSSITTARRTHRRARRPRRPTPSRPPARTRGPGRPRNPSPGSAEASEPASGSTRSGCPASWRTRRSSSAARDRRSRSVTTRRTGPRSCPAC